MARAISSEGAVAAEEAGTAMQVGEHTPGIPCKHGKLLISGDEVALQGKTSWAVQREEVVGVSARAGLVAANLNIHCADGRILPAAGMPFRDALRVIEQLGYISPETSCSADECQLSTVIPTYNEREQLTISAQRVWLEGSTAWNVARDAVVGVSTYVSTYHSSLTTTLVIHTRDGRRLPIPSVTFNRALRAIELLGYVERESEPESEADDSTSPLAEADAPIPIAPLDADLSPTLPALPAVAATDTPRAPAVAPGDLSEDDRPTMPMPALPTGEPPESVPSPQPVAPPLVDAHPAGEGRMPVPPFWVPPERRLDAPPPEIALWMPQRTAARAKRTEHRRSPRGIIRLAMDSLLVAVLLGVAISLVMSQQVPSAQQRIEQGTGRPGSASAVMDGMVFVASSDNTMYALDAVSGTRIWSYDTGNAVGWRPAIGS